MQYVRSCHSSFLYLDFWCFNPPFEPYRLELFYAIWYQVVQDIQHGGNPLEGFHSCYCAHGPVCAVKCKVHPSLPASAHASAPASHVSQCLWLLCGTKRRWRGGLKLSCRTERQKKLKVLREREWVMQGGFPNRKPGRERERERQREGRQSEWVSEWEWERERLAVNVFK